MNRILAFAVFMGAFSAVFQLGSMYEHTEEEALAITEEFLKAIQGIDGYGIFLHNLALALPMFIPGFGAGWGLITGWATGFTLSAITTANPELGGMQPLALLYTSPFGLMELTAYSLACSRSFLLIQTLRKRTSLRPALRVTLIEAAIVVGLLLAGGLLEYYMIEAALKAGIEIPGLEAGTQRVGNAGTAS